MLERGYDESLEFDITVPRLALAVAVMIATVLGINHLVGRYLDLHGPNLGYRYVAHKWNVLEDLEQPVDWLVLGDSSVSQAFDPGVLARERDTRAVNLGTIGNFGAVGDQWMLEEYLDRFGAPQRVVLVHAYDIWHRRFDNALIGRVPRDWVLGSRVREERGIQGAKLRDLLLARYARLYAERKSIRKSLELLWWRTVKDDDELGHIRAADRDLPIAEPELGDDGFVRMCGALPDAVASDVRGHRKFLAKGRFSISRDNRAALLRIAQLSDEHGFALDVVPGPVYDKLAKDKRFDAYFRSEVEHLRKLLRDHPRATMHGELRTYGSDRLQNVDHITCDAADDYTRWVIEQVGD